nr:hypothetical protein [Streptomyces sp. 846.5]
MDHAMLRALDPSNPSDADRIMAVTDRFRRESQARQRGLPPGA